MSGNTEQTNQHNNTQRSNEHAPNRTIHRSIPQRIDHSLDCFRESRPARLVCYHCATWIHEGDARLGLIAYKRSRFSTKLPDDRRYTAAHFWLAEYEPGNWRVGLTKFAVRMLGEIVEHDWEVEQGAAIEVGQIIGWVEGFKAVSDLFAVANGKFLGGNPDLADDLDMIQRDPYGKGWLYAIEGTPDSESVDVEGYISMLDATIDRMQGKRHD